MANIVNRLYQSKEWKIAITDECTLKIWKREPDKTWRPWMRIYAVTSFMGNNKNSYIISDDRVTDDDRQTHAILTVNDYIGVRYETKAPVTQRHLDALDAIILAKKMELNGR